MQHQQIKLKNGLNTLFIDSPGSAAGSVQIWFRAGSALEDKDNLGVAHFLEHMFFKGTKKRPGSIIAHEVESFGGEINAFTSFDYTCYYINTPNFYLNKTTEILLDMVSNPLFKHSDLLPERDVVFEEYRKSQDHPSHFSFHKIQANCFSKGYNHPTLGKPRSIKNFSKTQLERFRKNNYNLSNTLLVVSGDLGNRKKLIKNIERFKLPKGQKSIFPPFKIKKDPTIDIHAKDVRMSQLNLIIQAPSFLDKNAASEDLAINCMGHGETSRLYQKLVSETSLANSASGSTMYLQKGGVHFIKVTFPHKNLNSVLNELTNTIKEIFSKGLEKFELQKIKNQYIASKIYDKESLESYSFSLGHGFAQTGDIHCEDEFIARMKKTSLRKVNKSFENIFARSIHLNLQIPKNESIEQTRRAMTRLQSNLLKLKKQISEKKKIKNFQFSKFDPQVRVVKLKNGIKLLYRQNKITPTFSMHCYLKGGLSLENSKNNGTYNLMSSLLTMGYNNISYKTIKEIFEDNSASFGGFSGKNSYGLTMNGQTEHIETLLPHFMGSLICPDFPKKNLEHEREMVLRSIENQEENPTRHCFNTVAKLMFSSHPYSMDILGEKKTVSKLKRNDLLNTHSENIQKKEFLLTYCGDLEFDEVLDLILPHLDKLGARPLKKLVCKKYQPKTSQNVFIPFDREQTQIFTGIPTAKLGHRENLYLKMLTTHLSGQSSELFVEVRDRQGLCYSAQPVHFVALEGGYWGIYIASGHDKVEKAQEALKKIIFRLQKKGLSEKEFERIKKMIEGQTLVNIQTNEDYANIYSVPLLQGLGVDYYHKNNQAINELAYDDFQENIKKILKREANTVVVGREAGF